MPNVNLPRYKTEDKKPKDVEEDDLLQTIKDWFKDAQKHQNDWLKEAEESYNFVAGRQWTSDEVALLTEQERPIITFNRINPLTDAVSGTEVNNRQEVRYIPRKMGAVQVSEILTGAAKWVRDECDAEFEESHAFLDVITCGMGWTQTRLETDIEPAGMINIDRVDPMEMRWDPSSRKRNLADRRWQMRLKDVPLKDAKNMFEDKDLDALHAAWAVEPVGDEPHDQTEAKYYRNDQGGENRVNLKRKVRIVEVEWWEHELYYLVLDPFDGTKKQFSIGQHNKLKERIKELNKTLGGEKFELESLRKRRRVYKRAFVGNEILEVEHSPGGSDFTYKAITGKLDRNKGHWYGILRALKDPQRWANKWMSQALHILNTNSKGGLLAEADAFQNQRQAEEDWSSPDKIVWLSKGGLAKIKEKENFNFPLGFDKLMNFAVASIPDVSGINLNFLALQQGEEAAILDRQRKQTALTILAILFDNLRRYRREQGRLLLYYIINYISDGRLVRITEQENIKYISLVKQTEDLVEYDIIVDDNPTSPNQKERTWAVIMQLMPMLAHVPMPPSVWMEVLRQSPLPSTFIEGLRKQASQLPQPTPQQQLQMGTLIAKIEKDLSIAKKNAAEAGQTDNQQMFDMMNLVIEINKVLLGQQQPQQQQQQGQQQQLPLVNMPTVGGVQ